MNNVISLSGGKDSTAMLHMMLERGESIHSVLFFDTGWELRFEIEGWIVTHMSAFGRIKR